MQTFCSALRAFDIGTKAILQYRFIVSSHTIKSYRKKVLIDEYGKHTCTRSFEHNLVAIYGLEATIAAADNGSAMLFMD
jgi:hypothetical protein